MSTFNSLTSPKSINLYNKRSLETNLIWCKQIVKILKRKRIKSIIDVGCCYFQLYKEIKRKKLKIDYFGIDCDQNFLDIGFKKFPELKKKIKIGYFENFKSLKKKECILSSATLEHVDKPNKFINNLIKFSTKYIIIRTYVSEKNKLNNHKNKLSKKFINCNEFSILKLIEFFHKKNYMAEIVKDLATINITRHKNKERKKFFSNKKMMIMIFKKNYNEY